MKLKVILRKIKNTVKIKGDDSNNTPSENDKNLKELEDDSRYNSSNKEKKKKDKSSITAEIDVLITDVTKDELKKLTDGEYIKYYLSNYKKEFPDKFNIIIEACVNLSTQMNEKKVQIKKYNILSRLIEELYSINKNFLDDYLSPFKKNNKNIIKCPFFIFIITTNSAYNYFKISSKKFLEDSDSNYECKLFVYYVRFKLNEEVNNYKFLKNIFYSSIISNSRFLNFLKITR